MRKIDINKVTRVASRKALKIKKQSPHIFFGLGVIGAAASTFLACRATLKLEEVVDDHNGRIEKVKFRRDQAELEENEYHRLLGGEYTRTTINLGRLYGPSVVLGGLSIAALTGSHVQLARRNTALAGALTALTKAYDDYRARVQEEIGVERERDLYRGAHDLEITGEDGRKRVVKNYTENGYSPYARIFEESNTQWNPNAELNYMFVKGVESHMNQRLRVRGHVLLNDVYDALGMERTTAGAVVGWVDNSRTGDGYIDFGLSDPRAHDFVNGHEENVWLDFNVDGVIYEVIGD
jgi:hypothetical protein